MDPVALKIVVMLDRGTGAAESVGDYSFGRRGLREAMFLAYDYSEAIRHKGEDPSQRLWIDVGGKRWDHGHIIDTAISYNAAFPPHKVAILEELLDEFVPGFVESFEARQSHLSPVDRDFLRNISIGSEKQIKFAQDLFIDDDDRRESRMATLFVCMDMLEAPDVAPSVKDFAANILSHVPTCSVFWIEQATADDIRDMIRERYTGNRVENLSPEARRLGGQVDRALGQ